MVTWYKYTIVLSSLLWGPKESESRHIQVPSQPRHRGPEVRQRLHLELDDAAAAAEITAEASGQI